MASRNYEYLSVALNDTKQRVFELEPDAGRKGDELTGDCGVICYLEFMKIEKNNNI